MINNKKTKTTKMPKQNISCTEWNKSGNNSRFLGRYAFYIGKNTYRLLGGSRRLKLQTKVLDKDYLKPKPNSLRFFETMVRVYHSKRRNMPKDFRNAAVTTLHITIYEICALRSTLQAPWLISA